MVLEGQEEPLNRMESIVANLLARPDSGAFAEPVDWRGLGLDDYPEIIQQPMDLGTVQRKLSRGAYETAHECSKDVKLVWSNCMTYNAPDSDFYVLAKQFARRFEDKYRKLRYEYDVGDSEDELVDTDDEEEEEDMEVEDIGARYVPARETVKQDAPAQLAHNLLYLVAEEWGHLVQLIEDRCPQALEEPVYQVSGQREIYMDQLDAVTLQEVCQYAQTKSQERRMEQDMDEMDVELIDITGKRSKKKK